jgi:cyclophilin family peptidyl-prolyl cis-trans isomerase
MVQGGDPTGTGKGGTSVYGQKLYVAHPVPWLIVRPHKSLTHSPQRRRDPSRATVHGCRNPRNGQLGAQHQRFVSSLRLVPTQTSPPRATSTHFMHAISRFLGSQFFMTLAPTPFLDSKHTIFGRVSSGIRVLQRLGAVGVDAQDRSVYAPSLFFCASSSVSIELTVFKTGHVKKSRFTKLESCNSKVKVLFHTGSSSSLSYSFSQHITKNAQQCLCS